MLSTFSFIVNILNFVCLERERKKNFSKWRIRRRRSVSVRFNNNDDNNNDDNNNDDNNNDDNNNDEGCRNEMIQDQKVKKQ